MRFLEILAVKINKKRGVVIKKLLISSVYAFLATVALVVTATSAHATTITYKLTNNISLQGRNAGLVFFKPGAHSMFLDFNQGDVFLTIEDLGAVANITITGTALGQLGVGADPAGNAGTFNSTQGVYNLNFSFQATDRTATNQGYQVLSPLASIGTITNPLGQTISLPFTMPMSGVYFYAIPTITGGVNTIHGLGWPGDSNIAGDFGFLGTQVVPEPATMGLLGLGLLGAASRRRRKAA